MTSAPAAAMAFTLVVLSPPTQGLAFPSRGADGTGVQRPAAATAPEGPGARRPTETAERPAAASSLTARIAKLEAHRRTLLADLRAWRREDRAVPPVQADRIADLEQRVRAAEVEIERLRTHALRLVPGTQTPVDAPGLEPHNITAQSGQGTEGGQVTAGTAFNPSITVIPDGVYANDNRQGSIAEIKAGTDGFGAGRGRASEEPAHGGGLERGFNLRELEVSFSGSVDPYFDVWTTLAIGGGEVEAEEAYVQTRKLLPGLQVRFGKFYSGVGYLNRQHPHQWDFVDQALPYDLLLGGSLNEVGVQVNWLPALPVYALVGLEALQGENGQVAAHLGPETDLAFRDAAGPRLFTGFLKVSPDIGYSHALQFGVSGGRSRLHQEQSEDGEGAVSLDGSAAFLGGDLVYKYDSGKQYGLGDFSLQAEYLRRWKDLDVARAGDAQEVGDRRQHVQDGLYTQAVYGFAGRWTAGLRFDVVGLANRIDSGLGVAEFQASRRYTANLTFNPTEFSRLRVQAARGDLAVAGGRERYNELLVQFQMSLGAHGAHRF